MGDIDLFPQPVKENLITASSIPNSILMANWQTHHFCFLDLLVQSSQTKFDTTLFLLSHSLLHLILTA